MASTKRKADGDVAGESSDAAKKQMTPAERARDLNGWWALDLTTSDTLEKHLAALGMSEIPILAAVKAEKEVTTLQRFDITPTQVVIRKRMRLGTIDQKHEFGTPVVAGLKTTTATYEAGELVVTTSMPRVKGGGNVELLDSRRIDAGSDALRMHQHMVLSILSTGEKVETHRYYLPSDSPEELERLAALADEAAAE